MTQKTDVPLPVEVLGKIKEAEKALEKIKGDKGKAA